VASERRLARKCAHFDGREGLYQQMLATETARC